MKYYIVVYINGLLWYICHKYGNISSSPNEAHEFGSFEDASDCVVFILKKYYDHAIVMDSNEYSILHIFSL